MDRFVIKRPRPEPQLDARTIPAWSQEERTLHVEFDDNELTHDLLDLRKNADRQGNRKLVDADLEKITPLLMEFGATEYHIDLILDILLKDQHKLTDTAARKLIKLMLPRGKVSANHALKIIASLSGRRLSERIQATLLKWIVTIYDLIDSKDKVAKSYGILFHFLDSELLRPGICHLLYYMTRRVHVKSYRIRQLMRQVSKSGTDVNLAGLFSVYKDFEPSMVMTIVPPSRKVIFKHPDPELMESIQSIQARWNGPSLRENGLFKPEIRERTAKRRKVDRFLIPKPKTWNADRHAAVIEDMTSATEMVQRITKLVLPTELASIYDSRLLQHIVMWNNEPSTVERLNLWLEQYLADLLYAQDQATDSQQALGDFLQKVFSMAEFTRELLPAFEKFLAHYLCIWNGHDHKELIFKLIAFIKPASFDDIFKRYLQPLFRLYTVSDVAWKARLITTYTAWLKNWALLDWRGHQERRTVGDASQDRIITHFEGLPYNIQYIETMEEFVLHIDKISVLGLQMEDGNPILQHATLSFFEVASSLPTDFDIPLITVPSHALVVQHCLSTNGMAISRMCGVLLQYYLALQDTSDENEEWKGAYTEEYINMFNSMVTDVCNALWRGRALNNKENHASGFNLPSHVIDQLNTVCHDRKQNLSTALLITHSPALASYSMRFMEDKEKMVNSTRPLNEPVTAAALQELAEVSQNGGAHITYKAFREQLLDQLESIGFVGMKEFLYGTLKSLRQREEEKA
ncbi:hypothetical protein K450DRAFT_250142 [Umbelopsis ramanniana AG]|uniref:Mis6-domain-containing protein n=1 Tax=Umbelopsis ramanniana AG TaxID=1314678 RepID=A0AAD5HBB6_UMBRA|nr:uncharacterized protein K450DRAFT_250142 [Umbelopsis ramanniana AG]KAI8577817.1 hypothetical protein K450DRAFT_250142 [Umbelopsis ramanniana AG]